MVGHDDTTSALGGSGTIVSSPRPANASPVVTGLPPTADPYGTESTASRASLPPGGARGRPLNAQERAAYSALYPAKRERVNIP
jgi:hypothetical protein